MTRTEILRLIANFVGFPLAMFGTSVLEREDASNNPWMLTIGGLGLLLVAVSNVSDPPLLYVLFNARDQVSPFVRLCTNCQIITVRISAFYSRFTQIQM